MKDDYMIDGIALNQAIEAAKRIREIKPHDSEGTIKERLQDILDEDADKIVSLEEKVVRLTELLRKTFRFIEDSITTDDDGTDGLLINTDVADDIGLTVEEYQEIMGD